MEKRRLLLQNKAVKLRKKGLSYGEIHKIIPVSKSTLSFWLKSILLKPAFKKRLYTKQIEILSRGPQSQKERRQREVDKIIDDAQKEIKTPLALDAYRLMGAFLYWAEGAKTSGFQVSNSDPYLIAFMIQWIEKIFSIPPKNIKAWLNIYPQQNDLKLKKFWSKITNIPLENFGKSFVKPLSKNYKKNNLYYGTIKFNVARGTNLRYRVFGWIKAALKNVSPCFKHTLLAVFN